MKRNLCLCSEWDVNLDADVNGDDIKCEWNLSETEINHFLFMYSKYGFSLFPFAIFIRMPIVITCWKLCWHNVTVIIGRVRSDEIPFPASHQPPPPTPFGEIGCGCLPSSFNEAQSSGLPEFSFQGYFRWKEDIVCFEEPHWDYIPLIPSDKLSLAHTAVFTPHGDMPFCVDVYVFNANDAIPQSPSGAVSQCLCVANANVHGKYSQTRR